MTHERQGQLISCQQLSEKLDQVNIVDCRFDLGNASSGREGYLSGHIPGAVFADLNQDLAGPVTPQSGRHPLPEPVRLAAKLGECGVDRDKPVVVYDAGNGAMAARGWWILRWLGHDQVSLLDGGLKQWQQLGLPLEDGQQETAACTFEPQVRETWVVTTREVLESGPQLTGLNLLDARDAVRFRGEVEPIDPVAGHIPGSSNLPFSASLTESGLWKSDKALRKLWQQQSGGRCEAPFVMMCGSGVTACHLALSALQAGCHEPRLYVGSWSEWIRDPERLIGLGEA